MRGRLRVQRDDAGVTLPELLMVMAISTFIVGALAFSLVIALRNTEATRQRVGSSAQTLTAWFTGDVMATKVLGGASTAAGDTTGCVGDPAGTNVLRLERVQPAGDPTVALVSYQVLADGTGFKLVRVACLDGAVVVSTVVQNIVDAGTVSAIVTPTADPDDDPSAIGLVSLTTQTGTIDPATVTVAGSPRLPVDGVPCSVVAASPHQLVVSGSPGPLVRPATFSLLIAGLCDGNLSLGLPTAGGPLERPLAAAGAEWTATVQPGDATWTAGPALVDLLVNGTKVTDFPIEVVTRPCAVASATPTGATYEANGTLTGTMTLTVRTVGPCGSAPLPVTITGAANPIAVNLGGGPSTWTATIPSGAFVWTTAPVPRPRPVVFTVGSVRTGAGAEAGTFGIDLTAAPCRLVGDPSRILDTDATGQTTGNVTIPITTTGVCGALSLSVPTGTTSPDTFTRALDGGPTSWTVTIPRCTLGPPTCPTPGPSWADGPRTATLVDDDGSPLAQTFTLTAREVCSSTGSGVSPQPVLLAGTRLRVNTDISVSVRGNCGTVTLTIPTAGLNTPLALTGSTTRVRTLLQTDGTWTPGAHLVTIRSGTVVLATLTIDAQPSCAVVETIADPPQQIDVRSTNVVDNNERIRFRTTATAQCGSTLWVRIDPPGPTPLQMLPATLVNVPNNEWATADLDGLGWTRGQIATAYVHWSNVEPVGVDSLAGTFLVDGD